MQFTLRQINYFLAAAETGQFSAAAAQVHVTQTTITSAIKELEDALGVALFTRHHASGVSLTIDGQRFLEHAHNINAAVNAASAKPGTFSRDIKGTVRFLGTESMLAYYALPALARLKKALPQIDLQIQEVTRAELEHRIATGQADIGIEWMNSFENIVELDAIGLTRSRRQLWLCADHPLLERRQVSLHDVAKEPYVILDADDVPMNTAKFWKAAGLEPCIAYSMSSIEAVRSVVALGMAVTILSDVAYRPFSREGLRIDTRPLQEGLPPIEIGMVWKRGRELPPAVAAFKSYMELTFNGSGGGVWV